MAVCGRRAVALAKKSDIIEVPPKGPLTAIYKQLNLSTYKYHALGDYPNLIAWSSTTDNASTQTVRLFPQKHTELLC